MPRMSEITTDKNDAISERILDAAWERLSHYGLNKTTMVEIADDCQMSAANLYRYYKNKNDIAAACCGRAMGERSDVLRKVVRSETTSAADKLRKYAVRMVELNIEQTAEKCKISDLVTNMMDNNPNLVYEKIGVHHSFIAEILAQGNASGEFVIDDVLETAELVYTSLVVLDVPIFANLYDLEKFRNIASGIVDLILDGIGKR